MTLPFTFANLSTAQGAYLDSNFAAVGATGVIPCAATGTSAVTLTPNAGNATVTAYANYQQFSFVAPNSSGGTVNLQVSTLGLLPVYTAGGMAASFAANELYVVAYVSTLNNGAGGWQIVNPSTTLGTANVIAYGATGNGVTDDTAAINAALASGTTYVYMPPGTYRTTATLSMSTNNQKLIGAGHDATVIKVSSTSVSGITIGTVQSFAVQGLTISRQGTPTAGANGITVGQNDEALLYDVRSVGNYLGFSLGPTGWSTVRDCFAENNLSHGFYLANSSSLGSLQYQMINCLSETNSGSGYYTQAVAGPGGVTMGTWNACATFANSNTGASFADLVSTPINGVRLIGCFFGQDGNDEIALATHGGQNCIRDCFLELAGTGATGPGQGTAASNVGNGISTTSTVTDITISGCFINGMSQIGIYLQSTANQVTGCSIMNNGANGTAATAAGIALGASARLLAMGNFIGNSGAGTVQQYGIASVGDGNNISAMGCDLTGNQTASLNISTNPTYISIVGCLPNSTENIFPNGGLLLGGNATGGVPSAGQLNTATGLFKNNTAYTNP